MESAMMDWAEVMDRYYLDGFVRSGGSAFKLLLTRNAGGVPAVLDGIRSLAEGKGYSYAQVSAAQTRVDRIEQIYFAIARQIDWEKLITIDAANFLRAHDYEIPESAGPGDIAMIAEANGCDQEDLMKEIRRATRQEIAQDRRMCKEFRTAIAQLRQSLFFPRSVTPSDMETLSGWLRGEKVSAASLRDLRIYSKIGRHNAREILIALAHWLSKSVGVGLVIGLDLRALFETRPPESGVPSLRYSRGALMDSYEVIRQFIDETDEITHCVTCAVAPSEIVTDEKRSIFKYYALQSRLLSEVHDADRQDLLSAMVYLGATSGERTGNDE